MMYWDNDIGDWAYRLMALNMVVFWLLLITAIVLLARYLAGNRSQRSAPTGGSEAEGILADRYARGEIDDEEYRRRLAELRGATLSSRR